MDVGHTIGEDGMLNEPAQKRVFTGLRGRPRLPSNANALFNMYNT